MSTHGILAPNSKPDGTRWRTVSAVSRKRVSASAAFGTSVEPRWTPSLEAKVWERWNDQVESTCWSALRASLPTGRLGFFQPLHCPWSEAAKAEPAKKAGAILIKGLGMAGV